MLIFMTDLEGMTAHPDLTHLLLTRFNTAINYAPASKGLNEAWLRSRLSLFEQYCLPSVVAQKQAAFTWLVFCDAASPAWFRAQMASYSPTLTTVYIDGPASDEVLARTIRGLGIVNTPYLATTRLDNDDSIARDHLAIIQRNFRRHDREFLVFPFGLQSFRGELYNVYWPSNPFLSLIEKVQPDKSFTTILCVAHDKVRTAGRVRSIAASPQWLQVIHSANLLNSLRGWPRLSSSHPKNFAVNWPQNELKQSFARRLEFAFTAVLDRGRKFAGRFKGRPSNA